MDDKRKAYKKKSNERRRHLTTTDMLILKERANGRLEKKEAPLGNKMKMERS